VRSAVVAIVLRDALTDQRRCGAFASVAVLPALQFIMSAATCISFMVVRFQVVLPLPLVPPSVYVFVRTCVRARAAADAAVGLSKSCFHVPLCRGDVGLKGTSGTLLLLGRCRASTYSSSAPSAFFSATSHR